MDYTLNCAPGQYGVDGKELPKEPQPPSAKGSGLAWGERPDHAAIQFYAEGAGTESGKAADDGAEVTS